MKLDKLSLTYLVVVAITILLFSSCQKEIMSTRPISGTKKDIQGNFTVYDFFSHGRQIDYDSNYLPKMTHFPQNSAVIKMTIQENSGILTYDDVQNLKKPHQSFSFTVTYVNKYLIKFTFSNTDTLYRRTYPDGLPLNKFNYDYNIYKSKIFNSLPSLDILNQDMGDNEFTLVKEN